MKAEESEGKSQPGGDLVKDLDALGEYISKFTVPIIGVLTESTQASLAEEKWLIGTGVLLEVYNHFFVITVGHCIKGYKQADAIHLGELKAPKILDHGCNCVCLGQIRDWGYLEIDESVASRSIALGKQFLTKNDLKVLPPSGLKELEKPVIVAGFPEAIAKIKNDIHPQFLKIIALPEGCKTDFSKNPYFQNGVNLWITDDNNESGHNLMEIFKESGSYFKGMSGGGVWIPKTKNSAYLVALLGGGDNDDPNICLGVSVGSALRLISESEKSPDDLKKYILKEWDILTDHDQWHYL